ncbi:flagellar export chaperone FliS [Haliovirga abyssi]|uniref:Flagellar secretion chaperone FliS n=1 Tax=Haliovirga abyssi TaxID=2996794 RepID=A0AAU9D1Q1_9FUSO|nr:flagellar export chaperone FliS [Haliovirga abyssi]BDU49909.1 flagellar protein FliS [Haliovirga abyssi]
MAFNNNPYDKYKNTQIQTATPGQLILMLYEGAIKFCKFSKNAILEKNISDSNKYLIKTQDIVTELMISLDMKSGGDIAKNLYSIYDYMLRTLVTANMKKDISKITEVQELLEDLKLAWMEAVKKTGGVKPRR